MSEISGADEMRVSECTMDPSDLTSLGKVVDMREYVIVFEKYRPIFPLKSHQKFGQEEDVWCCLHISMVSLADLSLRGSDVDGWRFGGSEVRRFVLSIATGCVAHDTALGVSTHHQQVNNEVVR